jgi:hypothetical protein
MSDPSRDDDQNIYLVIVDLGEHVVRREANIESTELETAITDLLDGQYSNPIRVIAGNTAEGWSRDVSDGIAHQLRRRSDLQLTHLTECLADFVARHEARDASTHTSTDQDALRRG